MRRRMGDRQGTHKVYPANSCTPAPYPLPSSFPSPTFVPSPIPRARTPPTSVGQSYYNQSQSLFPFPLTTHPHFTSLVSVQTKIPPRLIVVSLQPGFKKFLRVSTVLYFGLLLAIGNWSRALNSASSSYHLQRFPSALALVTLDYCGGWSWVQM